MLGLIFTYIVSYGGAIISLARPYWGVLCYILLALLPPSSIWFWSVPEGRYSMIVALGLLVGWTFHKFGDISALKSSKPAWFLALFVLWVAFSTLFSPDREAAVYDLTFMAKTCLVFLIALTLIGTPANLKLLAWTLIICHAYPAFDLNLSYFRGYNRLYLDGFTYFDNNSYAIALVACVPIAFFMALASKNIFLRAAGFIAAGLMVHAILFSFSRGGMLGLLVSSMAILILIPKKATYLGFFLLALLAGIRLAGPQVQARLATTFASEENLDSSAASRIVLWKNCLSEMASHPLLGVGPGNWPNVAPKYGWPKGKQAHSLWMQIGAELGVPGLLFLISFYGFTIWNCLAFIRRADSPDDIRIWIARAVISALIGFAVSAQFVSLYRLETPYYIALLGLAAIHLPSLSPKT